MSWEVWLELRGRAPPSLHAALGWEQKVQKFVFISIYCHRGAEGWLRLGGHQLHVAQTSLCARVGARLRIGRQPQAAVTRQRGLWPFAGPGRTPGLGCPSGLARGLTAR